MSKYKVLYIINNAPDYRDKFLSELGKHVNLTVAAYPGAPDNLNDPEVRYNYTYIPLKRFRVLGVNLNLRELTIANGNYDCIIVGFVLNSPLRLLNVFRKKNKVVAAGLIYGTRNGFLVRFLRRFFLNKVSSVLVYTDKVKNSLESEVSSRVVSFNNTYFYSSEITPLVLPSLQEKLNILWVGRYQKRKKIERLYELARLDLRVNIRIIGPGLSEAFANYPHLENFEIWPASHGAELLKSFEWCHIVFNPGGAGLLVMNAGRMGRSIVIDTKSHHGPEIQLALDADQAFIDFSDINNCIMYVDKIFDRPSVLQEKSNLLIQHMHDYTIEHMVEKYLKAIKGE